MSTYLTIYEYDENRIASFYKKLRAGSELSEEEASNEELISAIEGFGNGEIEFDEFVGELIRSLADANVSGNMYEQIMPIISIINTVYDNCDIVYEDLDESYIEKNKLIEMINSFSEEQIQRLFELFKEHYIDRSIFDDLIKLLKVTKKNKSDIIYYSETTWWEAEKLDKLYQLLKEFN